jgi:hypothetical protein
MRRKMCGIMFLLVTMPMFGQVAFKAPTACLWFNDETEARDAIGKAFAVDLQNRLEKTWHDLNIRVCDSEKEAGIVISVLSTPVQVGDRALGSAASIVALLKYDDGVKHRVLNSHVFYRILILVGRSQQESNVAASRVDEDIKNRLLDEMSIVRTKLPED